MSQRLTQRVTAKIPENPLEFWLSRLDEDTQKADRSHFNRWMRWLTAQPGWETATPRDLLVRQLESDDSYFLLDLLQQYVNKLEMRKSSKRKAYSVIRSFFLHNRCALPPDPTFRVHGNKPPVQGKLTVSDIVAAAQAASPRYRSMILFKWQAFLDNERLIQANVHCSNQVVEQLQKKIHPVRLDLPGRKSSENDPEGNFFTYIGSDAVDALREYFEVERGWPKPNEPLWIYRSNGRPVEKAAFEATWLRLLRRAGRIPVSKGPPGSRYGFNLHEMRDEATTLLHTHAKSAGFDMDCVKLFCGQIGEIDPLKYDKFYRETDYVREQYLIAERHLNIVSKPAEVQTQLLKDREFVKELVKNAEFLEALRKALSG